MQDKHGTVYLVGAGPGDAGLLTVKAEELLKSADVVVYDRLVSEEILAKIPDTAEKINVGKDAGHHPIPQEQINEILLEKALQKKQVVRLKGGDPFLFGRGGEELELLVQNNIDFEVVPGITSAIAAAAYAGIPITHRDFCSSLHIITGHAKKDEPIKIDYSSLVKLNGTLVFMMSVSSISEISEGLITAGMDISTPAAVVENGTRPYQRKQVGTLKNIAELVHLHNIKSPAAIIVGKVCSMSDKLDWFSNSPLFGCKVLVTRPANKIGKLSSLLRKKGAEVLEYPCIKTSSIDFEIDIEPFSWLLFTSSVGVSAFFEKLCMASDSRALFGKKIGAVGAETAAELAKYGIKADFVPSVFDGKHLASELLDTGLVKKGEKIALYRAKQGGEDIAALLESAGAILSDTPVYETTYIKNKEIDVKNFHYAAFTSASCVHGFASCFTCDDFSSITAICIGEQTASAARSYGMTALCSDRATITDICNKIMEEYSHDKTTNSSCK